MSSCNRDQIVTLALYRKCLLMLEMQLWFLVLLPFLNLAWTIWKLLVHIMLKPSMQDFKHDLTSMGDECSCPMVSTFFGTTLLGNWNEDWPFLVHRKGWIFPVPQIIKDRPAMQETQVRPLGWEDLWRRKWQSTPVFFPGEFHGQRSLAGCSPWGRKSWTQLSN